MANKWPPPAIMIMDDWRQVDPATKPTWGPVGSWKPWDWGQVNPAEGQFDWSLIDQYLARAEALGKPVAISVNVQPNWGQDKTPAWVYRNAGVEGGWPGVGSMGTAFTYPRWNDRTWDAAWRAMIMAFGAKYDKDPRVHSIWACTAGLYGETALTWNNNKTGEKFSMTGHNPGLHFSNTLSWYAEAFQTKPVFPIITGTVDRLKLAQQAIALGQGPKLNGLRYDLPKHVQLRPVAGAGTLEVPRLALQHGIPVAYEHAYNKLSEPEGYWSHLVGLATGMIIFDGEIEHLDTLARINTPELGHYWCWLLKMMAYPLERVGMWIARDTEYPPPGNSWEHGWPGPLVRGVVSLLNVEVGKNGGALHSAQPSILAGSLYSHGGVGLCTAAQLVATVEMPAGDYDITTIWSPLTDAGWRKSQVRVTLDGATTMPLVPQPCWVHMVIVEPASGDVEPPPPPPPDDLAEIREAIGKILIAQDDLNTSVNVRLDSLAESVAHQLVAARTRIHALETWQDKVTDAIKTLM